MALVTLSDVIVPEIFTNYILENSLISTALYRSGVIGRNAVIEAQIQAGAESFTVPVWNDLDQTIEPNISSDVAADLATPNGVNAYSMIVRKSFLNNFWAEMSFASELAGSSALERIQSRVAAYWDQQFEQRLLKSLLGCMLSNIANNSGDMVVDISAATTGAPVTINGTQYTSPGFTRNAVIDAASTMGDRAQDLTALAMHSSVYRTAQKNNEIEFIRDSDNNIIFATYAGLPVIQDDNLTTSVSGQYVTILFGGGAVGFAITLANKNPAGLIYLLKAKFKMYDQPNKNDTINVGVQVEVPNVLVVKDHGDNATWAAKIAEQQRKLTAPTVDAIPLAPFGTVALPVLTAPAWKPKGLR